MVGWHTRGPTQECSAESGLLNYLIMHNKSTMALRAKLLFCYSLLKKRVSLLLKYIREKETGLEVS